jgi:acyl-CoA synthetase (AMP-forming)/AMP-acid ligase II
VVRDHDLPSLVAGPRERDLAPAPLGRPMMYTSGTTGTPKGVWSGILDEADADSLVREERELWGFAADDVNLVVSPLHHSAPMRFAGGTLLAGGDVVLLGTFDVDRLARAITEVAPTTAFMVPTHLHRLLARPDRPRLGSFRLLAHAGAPCPAHLKREAIDAFPEGAVWEFYGSTELQLTACAPDEWQARPGTVGRARRGRRLSIEPRPDTAEALDDAPDVGVVWCEVPPHARFEYWRDPERTAAAWQGDRCTVGDLGRLDDDGYLFLEGRRDDLIISGGMNVSPLEVERVLLEHPEIREAAVFAVDDEEWGQRVCAAVVGEPDHDELDGWLRDRLAPHKRPKLLVPVDEIPVSPTGKVRRSHLGADLGLT